jgi:hypothetical protein
MPALGLGLGLGFVLGLMLGLGSVPGVALALGLGETAGRGGVGLWRGGRAVQLVSVAASSSVEPAHASGFGRTISTSFLRVVL